MRRRGWITAALSFFVGVALGAGGAQSYRHFHEKETAEVFYRRLRCNELANEYARKESTDAQSVSVEMAGYSIVSNSCVAYLLTVERISPQYNVFEWRVMDLLSGERFYTERCREELDCGGGNNIGIIRRSETAFHQAVGGQGIDVGKIK